MGEWYFEDKLISENPQDFSLFGKSVAISKEKAIIGAPKVGAAYIFTRDEFTGKWMQEQRLVGGLGTSVDIINNTAIVGAPSYSEDVNEKLPPGAVFIYNFDSNTEKWLKDTMVTAADLPRLSHFGESVSISENRFVVGAPNSEKNDDIQFDSGSAFVFAFDESTNNWNPEVKLAAQDETEGARFGANVAINNGVVLVGEPDGIVNGKISGNGHLFYYKNTNKQWYRGDVLIKEYFGRRRHLGSLLALSDKRAALTTLGVDTVFVYELKNLEHSLVEPLASIKLKSETKATEHFFKEVEPSNQTADEICDNVYFIVDEMPEMVGGEETFRERIKYPDELRGSGIEGKVYVSFVVGPQGQVVDVKIARGDHELLNKAAIDFVRRTPYTNGSQKGEPVCVSLTIPVNFKE